MDMPATFKPLCRVKDRVLVDKVSFPAFNYFGSVEARFYANTNSKADIRQAELVAKGFAFDMAVQHEPKLMEELIRPLRLQHPGVTPEELQLAYQTQRLTCLLDQFKAGSYCFGLFTVRNHEAPPQTAMDRWWLGRVRDVFPDMAQLQARIVSGVTNVPSYDQFTDSLSTYAFVVVEQAAFTDDAIRRLCDTGHSYEDVMLIKEEYETGQHMNPIDDPFLSGDGHGTCAY